MTMNTSNIVPKEFIPGKHISLVYDNVDFLEESNQQTQVKKGIIIQKAVSDTPFIANRTPKHATKKKQRSIIAIAPYSIGIKKTPKFDGQI